MNHVHTHTNVHPVNKYSLLSSFECVVALLFQDVPQPFETVIRSALYPIGVNRSV